MGNLDALHTSLGSLLIGFTVSLWLYGITMAQIGLFFHNNCHERSWQLRALVWAIFVLENAQTLVISEGIWLYLVDYRVDLAGLGSPARSFGILVYLTAISNLIVRCVYAYRIHKIGGRCILVPMVVIVLSIMVATLSMIYGTQGVRMVSWESRLALEWIFYTGYACELVADFIITTSLVFILARKNVGLRSSDRFTQTLLIYTLNSGLLVMLCVIGSTVAYITMPHSFAFLAFYLVLGKLYANSLLGSLNARDVIFPRRNWEKRPVHSAPVLTSVVVLDEQDMLHTTAAPEREEENRDGGAGGSFDSDETRVEARLSHASAKDKYKLGEQVIVEEYRGSAEGLG